MVSQIAVLIITVRYESLVANVYVVTLTGESVIVLFYFVMFSRDVRDLCSQVFVQF